MGLVFLGLATACSEPATGPDAADRAESATFKKTTKIAVDQSPVPMDMSEWNAKIAAQGHELALGYFEYITVPESDQIGRTVFASDRGNKQLASDWVPNDPRNGTGTTIVYLIDEADGATSTGLTAAETSAAIQSGMQTWDDISCSNLPIAFGGTTPVEWGYVQWLLGYGGQPAFFPVITHAGWLPAGFFDFIVPNGSQFILGVTFTFFWTEGGELTDIDGNNKLDVALKEIYYNDAFPWNIGSTFDVETVAHHEAGHALSQAHFGDIFGTNANGKIHFAPRAVMNAAYSGVQTSPTGTDIGGHCSNWAQWPNN
jgi:hypothetical protein